MVMSLIIMVRHQYFEMVISCDHHNPQELGSKFIMEDCTRRHEFEFQGPVSTELKVGF